MTTSLASLEVKSEKFEESGAQPSGKVLHIRE